MDLKAITTALSAHLPEVLRWAGGIARQLRKFDISLEGKESGSPNTDALTLADLTVQELLVAALRDRDPIFRQCRLEAEESSGDLSRFATDGEFTIALDPIDGTKNFRDRTGHGYAVMLNLRSVETVHYSLVFCPEDGPHGTWVEAAADRVVCGEDNPGLSARRVLDTMPPVDGASLAAPPNIYMIGFQQQDAEKSRLLSDAGLRGFTVDELPGSIFPLMARGQFSGSLIHTPNVYDFPVSLHIARLLGGEALWVHNREPVHFRELWEDKRAHMLRLPGIVACSTSLQVVDKLCAVARDWSPLRYASS